LRHVGDAAEQAGDEVVGVLRNLNNDNQL